MFQEQLAKEGAAFNLPEEACVRAVEVLEW
jgi:hypothetical protein